MNNRQTNSGIMELDIHGMTKYQAKISIDSMLKRADRSIYRIRVIHGYHSGTELKNMVQKLYRSHNKVKRVELSLNPGITDLVLRDIY